ncbi:DUF6744 family protein [Ornithinibacillus contaminans]|uniref:DUF6744 family protein n=1 Tax=Ornithinibacillus contaminans TaxID=694055 RepID=UPI00064DB1F2|nr:DUF6744 family protein [Ornithinibacillus contaminans]
MNITEGLKTNEIVGVNDNQEGTIGNLFWYSIGNHLITREELEQKFNQSSIDHAWLPNPIRLSDAFRRATREIQQKKVPSSDPKKFLNFLTREVYSDTEMIQRNVVIETVDQSGKRLEYNSNAAVIKLDKNDGSIKVEVQEGQEQAEQLAREAEERFEKYSTYYASQNLRIMIAKILGSLAPTQVRPNGGVYFIPSTYENELGKLNDLVNLLNNSEAYSIPLFDTKDNRGMVNKKLHDDMLSVMKHCDSVLNKEGIPLSQVKEAIAEAKRIADTFKTYQSVVNLDVEVLSKNLNSIRSKSMLLIQKTDKY